MQRSPREFHLGFTHLYDVTLVQLRLRDTVAVDEGAVVGTEVLNHKHSDFDPDAAVVAGNLRIAAELMVIVRRAAKSRNRMLQPKHAA
jgi:hypothetical protein